MKTARETQALTLVAFVALAGVARADEQDSRVLLQALPKAKLTLAGGIKQAAQAPAAAISAKFEMDDKGQLSLSVYTAAKGLGTDAEHNTLQELIGSPESDTWKPETETFKDPEHVARASEQETLMSLTRVSLLDVVAKAAKHGGIVFSVTPDVRGRKPVFVALVANKGKVQELTYDLMTGAEAKPPKTPASVR
jgi:hypothetical protein